MASSTQNVKLGICRIFFGGLDLGYTKGGVEVEVSTDTHKVMLDQFGESEVDEYIEKRSCIVQVPLAETTVENMVRIMPGASLVDNGTKQRLDVTMTTPQNDTEYTITLNGKVYSYTSDADATESEILDGLKAVLDVAGTTGVVATVNGSTLELEGDVSGETRVYSVSGGDLAIAEGVAPVAGSKRVDVKNGIGISLLDIAQELRLHPQALADTDQSEDFVIPKAMTPGALQFSYIHNEERIFACTFTAYPDTTQDELLFSFGDPSA